jgi:hypothetical protein
VEEDRDINKSLKVSKRASEEDGGAMDIEVISGPRVNEVIRPSVTEELQPVGGTESFIVLSFDVRDRITISPDARRRYEEWRAKNRKRERERKTS